VAPPHICPACAGHPCRRLKLGDRVPLKQCPRCLLAWWDWPALNPVEFYDRDYFDSASQRKGYNNYAALEAGLRQTAAQRLRRIARLLAGSAGHPRDAVGRPRLLDIGCGTGIFLEVAGRAGWQAEGVEVSEYAARQARQRGLHVICQAIGDVALERATYDCVTLWDVIEHLPDPLEVLRKAAGALRAGGVLALSTGDVTSLCARLSGAAWHLFTLPEHLYFFSPTAIRRLFGRAGCKVVRVVREVNWVPVEYILERLGKSCGRPGRLVDRLLKVLRVDRVREWVVPATLLDVIGVYGLRSAEA